MHPMDVEAMPCCELKNPTSATQVPIPGSVSADREQHRAICGRPPRALRFAPNDIWPEGIRAWPY